MIVNKSQIKRILVITLSNIGDIILTTPVVKALSKEYPHSRIDVMVGPAGKEIFEHDPKVFKVIIYDKHMPMAAKRRLQLKLKKLRYDLIADLRNTIFPLLLGPKYRTATIQAFPGDIMHKIKRHLYRLNSFGLKELDESSYIYIPKADEERISAIIKASGVKEPIVVMAPGAKSHLKMWTPEGYAAVADRLINEASASVVFVGEGKDEEIAGKIEGRMNAKPFNFVNKTNIRQLAALLKRADLVITNDSAVLHLGCAVGAKVLALFGPTDPKKYGPTGEYDAVITKKLFCSPCEKAVCKYNYECMRSITPEEVFDTAKVMLEGYE